MGVGMCVCVVSVCVGAGVGLCVGCVIYMIVGENMFAQCVVLH